MKGSGKYNDSRPVKPSGTVIKQLQELSPQMDGKVAAIEPNSGKWFIGDTVIEAAKKGRRKHPKAVFYFIRIGYPAVDFQSGGLLKS